MDFILKKFVSFFLEPYSFIFVLLLLGLLFLLFNSLKRAKYFIFFSLFFTFLFSYSGFSNMLMKPLENKYPKIENYEKLKSIKYAILLGGDFEARAYEILKLYQNIEGLKIITSGYKGGALVSQAKEAKDELIKLGVSSKDIIMHESPKDTIEEAKETKNTLNGKKFFLVTSASHMPRAMMIFKKEGLSPIAVPTAHTIEKRDSSRYLDIYELKKTNMALHEYIGMAWLNLKSFLNK